MKVLIIATLGRTIDAFLLDHIKILKREGYEVHIAANLSQRQYDFYDIVNSQNCFNINMSRNPLSFSNLQSLFKLREIIKMNGYSVIYTHTPIASVLSRLGVKRNSPIKVVYFSHGFHFHKKSPIINWVIYYPIEKMLSRKTDIIITINKEDYYFAKSKLKTSKIYYLPGVGIKNIKIIDEEIDHQTLKKRYDARTFLSIGELNNNKNFLSIVKVLSKKEFEGTEYLIIGDGPNKDKIKNFINENDLNHRIKLLGRISDVRPYLNRSTYLILPSYREGLGMVGLEALINKLPVIGSSVHGIRDYCLDEKTGFLINPYDLGNIEKVLSQSLDITFPIYQEMCQNSYEESQNYLKSKSNKIFSEIVKENMR